MQGQESPAGYRCGSYLIDAAQRRLFRDGVEVTLEAKVFDLILLLVERRGRALSKQEVVEALWGNRPVSDAALSQLVYKARRALDDDGHAFIRTVYGRGLQWVAPVAEATAGPAAETAATDPAAAVPAVPPPARAGRRHRNALWAGLGALALVSLLSLWLAPRGMAPPAPPQRRVALLPVDNDTGDARLDWVVRGLPGLIANLLGGSRGVDVVDPLESARIWAFRPTQGRNRDQHVRYVTGAGVLVGGKLARLPDKAYALTLQVDAGDGRPPSSIVLDGDDPAALGVQAVSRLRRLLGLEPPTRPAFDATPRDAYLAETFARGMDLSMHGDWQGAKPYFALVTRGEPDFLPARFLLADAQGNTNELRQADIGYATLLADAIRLRQPYIAARVLASQTVRAINRHEDAKALQLSDRALAMARQSDNPEVLARALLTRAKIHARLKQTDAALRDYGQARELVEETPVPRLQSLLQSSMVFIADAKGDADATLAAARAELATDDAQGNERGSAISSFNLAYALAAHDRPQEALPLLARTWNWCKAHEDNTLLVAAGNQISSILYEMGAYEEVVPVIDTTARLAAAQGNAFMQSRMLDLRAGGAYLAGHGAEALALSRKATALIDPAQDPATAIDRNVIEAFVALQVDPASLAGLRRRVDAQIARVDDPSRLRSGQYVIHALAAAAAGNPREARTALDAARDAGAERDFLQEVALNIALAGRGDAVAQALLRDFDPAASDVSADTLRLYGQWAGRRGDAQGRRRAEAKLASLHRTALDTFDALHLDLADR